MSVYLKINFTKTLNLFKINFKLDKTVDSGTDFAKHKQKKRVQIDLNSI